MHEKELISQWNKAIRRNGRQGIYKRWVHQTGTYYLACAYLEKARNIIQDFQDFDHLSQTREGCVYLIVMTDWMFETYCFTERSLLISIQESFKHDYDDSKYCSYKKFVKALRSFVVAHPFNTNRSPHKEMGFDGNWIAIDICPKFREANSYKMHIMCSANKFEYLSVGSGLDIIDNDADCFIQSYFKNDLNARPMHFIGFKTGDLIDAVNVCIDKFAALDTYLRNQKLKHFLK